jgi:hypothetical protein
MKAAGCDAVNAFVVVGVAAEIHIAANVKLRAPHGP